MPARSTRREPDQTAVAVFDPTAAGKALKAAIDDRRPQLAALLGAEAGTARGDAMLDRFITVALHAATSRPDIIRATRESLVEAIRDSAMLGLEPVGATGDGAIVVYRERVKQERPSPSGTGMIVYESPVDVAHFQPMYRGLLKLARRSGQIAHIDAHVVYQGDEIELELGSQPLVRHSPALDGSRRGDVVGVYAVAELANGRRYVEWMTRADVELVRRSSRAKDSGPWVSFWDEMARKTVLRRLMKRLPLETMAEHALRIETEAESLALSPGIAAEPTDTRRRLRDRFSSPANGAGGDQEPAETPPGEPEPPDTAGDPETGVSGDPSASEIEAVGVEVCGATSDPAMPPVEICVKEPGHSGVHDSAAGTTWPATGEVRGG